MIRKREMPKLRTRRRKRSLLLSLLEDQSAILARTNSAMILIRYWMRPMSRTMAALVANQSKCYLLRTTFLNSRIPKAGT